MKTAILTENQAVKGQAFPIEVVIREGGDQLVPSSATITVKDPEGEAYVEDQSMSIEAGVGTLTYSLVSTHTGDLEENAIIEVTFVHDSVTDKAVFLFDIVLNKLSPCISDEDLKDAEPKLGDQQWSSQDNYDKQIASAWEFILQQIKNRGKRPHMLIDGTQLKQPHILKTLELIYFAFSKSSDDIWWEKYLVTKEKFEESFSSLVIKYDTDEDGLIDESERGVSLGQINLER